MDCIQLFQDRVEGGLLWIRVFLNQQATISFPKTTLPWIQRVSPRLATATTLVHTQITKSDTRRCYLHKWVVMSIYVSNHLLFYFRASPRPFTMPLLLRTLIIIIYEKNNNEIACRQLSYLIKNFATTQKSVFLHENYTIYENYPHGI
jgi:hypothetical protein